MSMNITLDEYGLPSRAWCEAQVRRNSASALERFIFENEPVTPGSPESVRAPDSRFRKGLAELLREIEESHISRPGRL